MKKLYGYISALYLLLLLGIVGGMEIGSIELGSGVIWSIVALAGWVWFAWLSGAFEQNERRQQE